jgi:pimeloyl-ACP methyl ester carboxylesterase
VTSKARPAASRLTAVSLFAAALLTATLALAAAVAPKTTELGHGPTVVFVSGLGSSRNDWLPTARKLLGRYRVVLVDLPGNGDSPLPDPFSFAIVGDAIDAVLAKQNPDSTIVVAHQMGGRAALAALAAHPGHAKGLVLVDVAVGLPMQVDDQQKKQVLDMLDQSYESMSKMMFSNMGRDTTQSKAIYTAVSQTPPATIKAYVREGFFTDGNKDAKALKVPTRMLITGGLWKSGMTSGAALKRLGWDDTTATVLRIPEAAYWVMKDQPDTLAAIISDFAAARIAAKK